MTEIASRTRLLLGDKVECLKDKSVLIFGVGGVGGYVVENLARCGVGHISVVDYDTISVSNINRQIIALNSTVGENKVDCIRDRVRDINNSIEVLTYNLKYDSSKNSEIFTRHYDYVIDCIDDVSGKVSLIKYCKNEGINIISAMGAGNRYSIPNYTVMDIFSTSYDGLAKVLRKKLREEDISSHTVVTSTVPPVKVEGRQIGSICYHPMNCASVLAAYVINELIK